MKLPGPYILVTDDDGHWYVIPKSKHARWEVWLTQQLILLPDYAQSLGGSPSCVEFMEYTVV